MVMVPGAGGGLAVSTEIDESQAIAVGQTVGNRQPESMVDRRGMEQHHVRARSQRDGK